LTPTTTCSPDSIRHRRHQPGLQHVDRLERATEAEHVVELCLGRVTELDRAGFDDV
jgi:hypothetical protein